MAHVALIGASGRAGSPILKELSDRGHKVTAIARNPEKIAALPNVTAKKGDVFDKNGLTTLLKGHDAVVSAVHFTASDPGTLVEAVSTRTQPAFAMPAAHVDRRAGLTGGATAVSRTCHQVTHRG